ncbi:proton-coupled amino acid transporter-like protein CG1139 isoform X2 [Halyomorpha halys]|uniref:proton-coupled amino acid transporter-like protein CG1139 isoform X2 n=1 Tax=Halyomorpha halys TaxID=286706 RepID=UPI0006D4E59F|nr:proton-coupled amino acid transporter-like protein CG1139 isoform X2 [Halyomorpha halys]
MFLITKILSVIRSIRSTEPQKTNDDVESTKGTEPPTSPRTTYLDGLVHMFRATVGTGILALPVAFSQLGYVGGIIGVVFILFISNYCAVILVDCQRELTKRNKDMIPSYQGTVQAAFASGPKAVRSLAPIFVTSTNIFILLGQIGGLCVYIVFIASNIKAAVYPHWDMDLRYFELIIFIPILAINMVLNLKKLSMVSTFGNAILLTSVAVVLYYIFREPISMEGKHAFGSINDIPQFFGTVFFASCCITMVLPLQNEMKREDQLVGNCGVLNVSAYLYGTLYVAFGLLGYLKYDDKSAGSITLNLPPGERLAQAVQLLLALSVLTATAIHNYIGVSIIWDDYVDKRLTKHRLLAQYLIRISTLTITLLVSLLVPNLELLLSVTGVLGQCTLSTTIPCIVHMLTYYEQPSFWAYVRKFWIDAIALIITVIVLIFGLASALFNDA